MPPEGFVPDRIEPVGHDPFEREDVGGLRVALHDDDLREAALDLHERVREPLDPVPAHGVHRAEDGPELVRSELVEDPEALVVVLGARDERSDVRPGIDAGVRVRALGAIVHQLLPGELGRRGSERGDADADDADLHRNPAGTEAARPAAAQC